MNKMNVFIHYHVACVCTFEEDKKNVNSLHKLISKTRNLWKYYVIYIILGHTT